MKFMERPEISDKIFFAHPHNLYTEGIETAFPNIEIIVDQVDGESTIQLLQDFDIKSKIPSGSNVMVFKPAPKIEFLAKTSSWNLIASSNQLNRRFEDKLQITDEFLEVKLPVLPFEIVAPNEISWGAVKNMLGDKVVAQTSRGHAGSSSSIIETEDDWDELVRERGEYPVKFAKFEEGETWTLNACVTHHGTLVSRPFLQVQGIDMCGSTNALTTCGNSHEQMEDDLALDIMSHAENFGKHLYEAG